MIRLRFHLVLYRLVVWIIEFVRKRKCVCGGIRFAEIEQIRKECGYDKESHKKQTDDGKHNHYYIRAFHFWPDHV